MTEHKWALKEDFNEELEYLTGVVCIHCRSTINEFHRGPPGGHFLCHLCYQNLIPQFQGIVFND